MKEIEAVPGSSLGDLFTIAWRYVLKTEKPITFIHNGVRVTLFNDTDNEEVKLEEVQSFPKEEYMFDLFPIEPKARLAMYKTRMKFLKQSIVASNHKEDLTERKQ
jgi:hypothetical protein